MKIDGNELAIRQDQLEKEGRHQESWAVKQEFYARSGRRGITAPARKPVPITATALNA